MSAVDEFFRALLEDNPGLRPRVGNPDELASNRLTGILADLKHRVNDPESRQESIHGKIITALNEEAVVSACLANKAGLNRSEEHTSELQSRPHLVCRLLLEKKKTNKTTSSY